MALLAFLDRGPTHGFALKQSYDSLLGGDRELKGGQVYSTLARLERDDLVRGVDVVRGSGPDRKVYAITEQGVSELEAWLTAPVESTIGRPGAIFTRVVLALAAHLDPAELLDQQRRAFVQRSRQLMKRTAADVVDALTVDYEIAHLEADLRWMEAAVGRLPELRSMVDDAVPASTRTPGTAGGSTP